jgi:hypothetical protein
MLLTRFNVPEEDRPGSEERTETDEPIVFCKKGCYSKWLAAKKKEEKAAARAEKANANKRKKVPWEEDGCLETLMDWMTTEGNYADYCGATGNKGKSKAHYQKEIALLLKEKHPTCDRNEKDVENKIVSLERLFRNASDWLENTGQGVDDPGDIKVAVKQRCPLYYELEPVMGDRPNAKPLASTDGVIPLDNNSDASSGFLDDDGNMSGVADTAAIQSIKNNTNMDNGTDDDSSDDGDEANKETNNTNESDTDANKKKTTSNNNNISEESTKNNNIETTPAPSRKNSLSSLSTSGKEKNKRLKAASGKKPGKVAKTGKQANPIEVDGVVKSFLGMDNGEMHSLRLREIEGKERHMAAEERARTRELDIMERKAEAESELIRIQSQAALLQSKAALLKQRKELKEAGVDQDEIDLLLPLK